MKKALLIVSLTLAALWAGETRLGKPFTTNTTIGVDKLMASPDQYVGKIVQVKGKVRAVCQHMGCWMELADESGKYIRIKVEDGVIEFPKTAAGKIATAEGKLAKVQMTKDEAIAQAKHEAEANGRKFDPASITSGKTYYQIEGTGAVIAE